MKSDKFNVDDKNKVVSLTKKNKKRSPGEDDENKNSSNKKAKVTTNDIKDDKASKEVTNDVSSIDGWRKENKIVIKHAKDDEEGIKETERINKDSVYFPFDTFEKCKTLIDESLIRQCTDGHGFKKPSPIQAQAWPILMHKKRDVVGIAETGSGKTLAFGIPAFSSMSKEPKPNRRAPRMLVLSPTRELAMQVDAVLQEYGTVVGLKSLVLYGGVPKYTQVADLKKKDVDCLVATPGRLKDLINEGTCDLSKVQHLVLDEADRMLDMGFEGTRNYIFMTCVVVCFTGSRMYLTFHFHYSSLSQINRGC
jgi:ATP-dependent RNA helicase DBP3